MKYVRGSESTKTFEENIKKISHFKIHPQMIPFVGKYYGSIDSRLLVIAKNPIIDEKFSRSFFERNNIDQVIEDWYENGIEDIKKKYNRIAYAVEKWTNLEKNIIKYAWLDTEGRNIPSSQKLFSEIIKVSKEIDFFKENDKNIFSYITFMDYFQRPNYLNEFIPNIKDKKIAHVTLMEIIKVINPNFIYFVCDEANNIWNEDKNTMENNTIIFGNGSHPGYWFYNTEAIHYTKPDNKNRITGRESFKYFIEINKIF
jgi:hypothetical protein